MAISVFGTTPNFVTGQAFSATAHGNALQAVVQSIADSTTGVRMPFDGVVNTEVPSWTWVGVLRHKSNDAFSYHYEITSGSGNVYIGINGLLVPGSQQSGLGQHTGTTSISTLGLVVNQFYQVVVWGDTDVQFKVYLLCEGYTPTLSVPASAIFADGATPSAIEFQTLSAFTDELAARSVAPNAAVNQNTGRTEFLNQRNIFTGSLKHSCRYLAYAIELCGPHGQADADVRWTVARIYVNGVLVAKFCAGHNSAGADGAEFYRESLGNGAHKQLFSSDKPEHGLIDLDTYAPGLVIGNNAVVQVVVSDNMNWDLYDRGWLYWLYETPSAAESVLGWQRLINWVHGDYVYGGSFAHPTVAAVGKIRDNVELLDSIVSLTNYPARQVQGEVSGVGGGLLKLYNVRKWRWLHFRRYTLYNTGDESDFLAYVTVNAGGTGYAVNDILAVTQGSLDGTLRVTAVSSGVVTGLAIENQGTSYTVANAVDTTNIVGSGVGCKVNIVGVGHGDAGTLTYTYGGKIQSISLDHDYGISTYGLYDLDSAQGLYVGTRYTLSGVSWALEDTVS